MSVQSSDLTKWLEQYIGFESYQHLGGRSLSRIEPFFSSYLTKLKNRKVKVITVAGTNGKGQTCYAISEALTYLKQPHALFISPHVHSIAERFQKDDGFYDLNVLLKKFEHVYQEMNEFPIKLSFFEFLFAVFLDLSLENNKNILILEVGVGGRLDATNLIDADVAVVTSIGRDHQDLLGNRMDGILKEKLAIARKNKPLITAFSSDYLSFLTQKFVKENEINHFDLIAEKILDKNTSYGENNRTLAYWAVKKLLNAENFSLKESFCQDLPPLPARGEELVQNLQHFIFFGSHNLAGMRAWIRSDLAVAGTEYDYVLLAFSQRSWSDICFMIKLWVLAVKEHPKRFKKLIITQFEHSKAFTPNPSQIQEIQEIVANSSQTVFWLSNWKEFNRFPTIKVKNTKILVIGSFYFASAVKSYFHSSAI